MANNILEAPAGVTKTVVRTAARSGRFVLGLGEPVPQPGKIPTEVQQQQAILRRFEGRFLVASNLLSLVGSERRLKEQVVSTADPIVGEGLVDEHTAVELRPVLPADALRDPAMNARRESVLMLLEQRYCLV